jgi:hypothetical protein
MGWRINHSNYKDTKPKALWPLRDLNYFKRSVNQTEVLRLYVRVKDFRMREDANILEIVHRKG